MSKCHEIPRHGSPEDRGGADRYYMREFAPHYFVGNSYASDCVDEPEMTADEIAQYQKGWDEQEDRKDWGTSCFGEGEEHNEEACEES